MSFAEQENFTPRDFNTISPSARSLRLMKGHTDIPFARQAAELISRPERYQPDFANRNSTFWARTAHFETRYKSIDRLLEDLTIKNVLEISSGFSFRGLEAIRNRDVHYIDTDLPDMVPIKKQLTDALKAGNYQAKGVLEVLPLNALDEKEFEEVLGHFPDEGPVAIVNEGLLMYLNINEKKKLCGIIRKILAKRGGYWITADIYIKKVQDQFKLKLDKRTEAFFEQHRIEDNKFESFESAENFFKEMGFAIDRVAHVKRSDLSSLRYLLKSISFKQLFRFRNAGKMQETWRLRVTI